MPEATQKFFLTTPIYYVNARPHIGHAYTTIVADVLARRHRLQGDDTYFLTGTDEHGQKIERSAAAAGIPPQQFADQVSKTFSDLWARMGITHDKFIRTTDPAHKRGVQKLFRTLLDRGHIYLDSYTGAYCVSDETFVDVPAGTPCPDCGRPTETVTEENFFFDLSNFQLKLLNLIESNELEIQPESRRNEVLSFLRGGLKDLSISRSSFTWGIPVPNLTELSSFAEGGGPASRPSSPTKQDHVIYVWLDALANYMTALGYGSDDDSLWQKFWPADLHIVGKEIIRFHCVYWPAFLLAAGIAPPKKVVAHGWLLFEESKMSKSKGNIVRTETILDAFGTLCPPPPLGSSSGLQPAVPGPVEGGASAPGSPTPLPNSVILSEAASQSHRDAAQSKDPEEARPAPTSTTFPTPTPTPHDRDLFAADVLRYFLLREIPFGQDGSFSFDALITRYNADLANGYGNLVSRTLNMITRYFEGTVPPQPGERSQSLAELVAALENFTPTYDSGSIADLGAFFVDCSETFLNKLDFAGTLKMLQILVSSTDQMLTLIAPWKRDQSSADGLRAVNDSLYTAAESIRIITALLYPILPYATANVWRQLGLGDIELAAKNGELTNLQWGGLKPGTKLGPLSPIFPRADKGLALTMTEMESKQSVPSVESVLSSSPEAPPRTTTFTEPTPGTQVAASTAHTTERDLPPTDNGQRSTDNVIAIDDFAKIDLRVAKILVCERIPKADKLLRLEVDLGYETRQILSGIAEWYTPEELIGRRIVVITNLAPRKMRGLESHGMLLAASTEGGKPHLATCGDADDLPLGSRLK